MTSVTSVLAHADGIAWDEILIIVALAAPLIGGMSYVVFRLLRSNR